MSVKYQVRKVRRDGVSQRYWVAPTSEYDKSVESIVVKQLQHALETRQPPEISPASNEGLFHAYANALQRKLELQEDTLSNQFQLLTHLEPYLAVNLPEAQRLVVRLATEAPRRTLRSIAMEMCKRSVYETPSLLGEIAIQSPDRWGVDKALTNLREYIDNGLRYLFSTLFQVRNANVDKAKFRRSLAKGIDVLLDGLNGFDGKWQIPELTLSKSVTWMRDNIGDILELPLTQKVRRKMERTMQAIAKRDDLDDQVRQDAVGVARELRERYEL